MKTFYILIALVLLAGLSQASTLTVCSSGCAYLSIQEAVYAAKTNDTIEVSSGTYNESVFLTKTVKFVGKDTGSGEPIVIGELYTTGYQFSLRGFGFDSVKDTPISYSLPTGSLYYWIGKAYEYQKQKSYNKALEAISNALKIDPKNALALNRRGLILDDQGRSEEALEAYEKSTDADPLFSSPLFNKGNTLYNLKEYNKALEYFNNAIEANPTSSYYWRWKGHALDKLGKYDEGMKAYEKAIEINPEDSIAWIAKGTLFIRLGEYDEALSAYNAAIDLNPSSGDIWQLKSLLLQKMNRNAEADEALDRAKQLGYQD